MKAIRGTRSFARSKSPLNLGAKVLILTNASGGINEALQPGSLMALTDHVEWNRPNCWRYPGPGGLGGERPSPYSVRLLDELGHAARTADVPLHRGVYLSVTGPCYETPTEIRAAREIGADAVGMSTTREALRGQSWEWKWRRSHASLTGPPA